jgi:dTDP-4-amino-4,6-dideoxygalactose transaminase
MTPMPPDVPLVDLDAQYRPLRDEILAAITRVSDSQRFVMGPETAALEDELSGMLGVEHAVAVSSGTDAVLLALMTIGIKAGDEVITPSYTFCAPAGAIARLGARPVFVDIDPRTFNIDPSRVEAAITPRTRAVLPVHLFGLSADLDPIVAAAARAGMGVVEDAAQAIGATYRTRVTGGFGACGCFSFYPSKNLGAFGDAGLLTTRDPELAARARRLRQHGMDELQAAVLRVKAPHLPAWTEARRLNARRYAMLFQEARLADRITLPLEPAGCRHVFNQFVIRSGERDGLKRHLDARGIGNEIYYPVPLHLQPCFADLGYRAGDFPEAERAAAESLAIPVYAELTLEQQQTVVDAVGEYLDQFTIYK